MVISTYPNESNAIDSARRALENKTAVCVNITSVRSLYWWKEKIEDTNEYLAIFKTLDSKLEELKRVIKENHPYTVPEIVELEMDNVSKSYLDWMIESIKK